jgi:hypothetical protein
MRWRPAVAPEVGHGRHNGLTEMAQPDVVHSDARSQRIVAVGDPAREREAPARALRGVGRRRSLRVSGGQRLFNGLFRLCQGFFRVGELLGGIDLRLRPRITHGLTRGQKVAPRLQHRLFPLQVRRRGRHLLPFLQVLSAGVFQLLGVNGRHQCLMLDLSKCRIQFRQG